MVFLSAFIEILMPSAMIPQERTMQFLKRNEVLQNKRGKYYSLVTRVVTFLPVERWL